MHSKQSAPIEGRYHTDSSRKIPWYRVSQRNFDKICIWSAPISGFFFFLIFCTSNFLPPIGPSLTAEQVVQHYERHIIGIKAGAALMQFAGPFYCMFIAAVSGQMSRIPGCSHAMIATQAISGGISAYTLTIPSLFFTITSYRLDRPPEITMLMNDISWMFTVVPFTTFISQNFAWSYAILMDKRERPLFPHWFAWFSTAWPFAFWGALGLHCVYTGPFAWNGGFCFWFAAAAFGIGQVLNVIYLLKAVNREDDEPVEPPQDKDLPTNSAFFGGENEQAEQK